MYFFCCFFLWPDVLPTFGSLNRVAFKQDYTFTLLVSNIIIVVPFVKYAAVFLANFSTFVIGHMLLSST